MPTDDDEPLDDGQEDEDDFEGETNWNFDDEDALEEFDFNFAEDDPADGGDHWLALPVFRKAQEIGEITRVITESIEPARDVFGVRDAMLVNGQLLATKIAAAAGEPNYSPRLDHATLVRLAARELIAQITMCRYENLCNRDYLHLLRTEIEHFRLLYLDWVNSFDPTTDIEDDWNPKK